MRWTRTLIPTLREDPSDAEVPSHKLMVRSGMIRALSAGVYCYLPLGTIAVQKAANIVRDEMNKAGAVEVYLPVLQPPELWQESGRYDAWGDELLKVKDRKGKINVLGPTHEEVITHIVRNEISSYRQLPITLYQVQVKLRDEPRPRAGVIRSREFTMKDAYSFDLDERGLEVSYRCMYDAYCKIFDRAGLKYNICEADTGLMGGAASHEYMVPSPYGEDHMVLCPKCKYTANVSRAECVAPYEASFSRETKTLLPIEELHTPEMSTVEQVAGFLGVSPTLIVKTIIYQTEQGFVAALVRGDHEINESKLAKQLKVTSLTLATREDVEKATGGAFGFSGPVGLKIPVVCDLSIEHLQNFVTGANKKDTHFVNTNLYRDFKPQLFADIRMAKEGDLCARCMAKLEFVSCIEVGHIFKLGTRYSQKMGATYINERGEVKSVVMGCYGIGVNRIVAAAVECHHDQNGIIWPKELAPYHAILTTINPKDEKIYQASMEIYDTLRQAGFEVLWDDRDMNAGVKFMDADLVGLPVRVTIGNKSLQTRTVDLKLRNKQDQTPVSMDGIHDAVKNALAAYRP